MANELRYKNVTKTRILGYDSIPLHRPKFIYFEFTGLRADIPHWIFFGGIEVTKFVNTSYTKANYETAAGSSVLKEPGEIFTSATEFPAGNGLTYGGATAQGGPTDPLYTDANGVLKGVFYLQSNTTYNWSINSDGIELLAKDTFDLDKNESLSIGNALFRGFGQYENYWEWQEQEAYYVWVEPARTYNDGGNDNNTYGLYLGADNYNYYVTADTAAAAGWQSTTANNDAKNSVKNWKKHTWIGQTLFPNG
jgi:hypothetical protein